MPASLVMSTVATERTTRSFNPSDSQARVRFDCGSSALGISEAPFERLLLGLWVRLGVSVPSNRSGCFLVRSVARSQPQCAGSG